MSPRLITVCQGCLETFAVPVDYDNVRFCSDFCRKAFMRNKPCTGDIPKNFYSKKRRREYRRGDKIDRYEVFEHHGWICNICGCKIDKSLKFPNKRAATLDHLIPLSRGGRHVWENVAPAHADCNEGKGSG
jgi:5-methylcytosine-specific restriction endonuclease McrA